MFALSSTKVEHRALNQVSVDIAWINNLLMEPKVTCLEPVVVWCDNQSAITLSSNAIFHGTKYIEIELYFFRE